MMVDRSETRPLREWLNPRLINSPFVQPQSPSAPWSTPRIQSTRVNQLREQRITVHDLSSRTINPNRNRRLRSSVKRPLTRNNDERPTETSSTQTNQNQFEVDQQNVQIHTYNDPMEERIACEITMSYVSTTASDREEIIVIQQYSSGETSMVYRGYLTKGETFTFKSQRRPTSSLSLAFYAEGTLASTIKECCEFKCVPAHLNIDEQKRFHFKEIKKANPCEKCRKENAEKFLQNNEKNTLLVPRNKKPATNYFQPPTHLPTSSDKHQQDKKSSKAKKSKPQKQDVSSNHHHHQTETTTAPTNPSEAEKPSEEKPNDATEDADDSNTITIDTSNFDIQQILQMFLAGNSSTGTRHQKSVENFCYIIESQISISTDEQQTLRGLINLGYTFDDINSQESIDFLKKITKEKIILILSKTSMENLSKPIREEPYLCGIYVIDATKTISSDSNFYRGAFHNIADLCKQLENDLPFLMYHLTSFNSMPANQSGLRTLTYVQALKNILLQTDGTQDSKRDMINFCREEYAENDLQLRFIDEFEKNFQVHEAIQWYLREETFLYKMLTRALRAFDPDILYKLRYFIQHLHNQLKSTNDTSPLMVYRTLRVQKEHYDNMKNNPGGLLSFNEFVLLERNLTKIQPPPINKDWKLLHFEISLGSGIVRCNHPTKPDEILLTFGTLFRIDKIEPIDEDTFHVKLTTNNDILKAGELMTKDINDSINSSIPLVSMLQLMKHRKSTGYMEYFCSLLIDDPQVINDQSANITLGGILHSLGTHHYERKHYEQALDHLQNSLKTYIRFLPADHVKLSPTYNNIGSIYHKLGQHERALEYHKKAYEMQKNSSEPDMDSVSSYAGNIASILSKLGQYKEAIPYLEIELQIKQKLHPNLKHPEVAVKYFNLAGAQYRAHLYSEALNNYEKCLQIELKCHTADNPTVATSYFNMATALEKLGRLQEAKDAVEQAIQRLLLTKKEDNEEIQMQRKYLEYIEKKLWMKNLFDQQ
ncbi:hypothetical protein I4U23_003987 [Adineta vaga]|nr:hypothetical protein I4U23_003987 [Adineta vaga]